MSEVAVGFPLTIAKHWNHLAGRLSPVFIPKQHSCRLASGIELVFSSHAKERFIQRIEPLYMMTARVQKITPFEMCFQSLVFRLDAQLNRSRHKQGRETKHDAGKVRYVIVWKEDVALVKTCFPSEWEVADD